MLEIIALIFLTKKNGELAEQKGLKPGTWKWYTVGAWIGLEILVAVILAIAGLAENVLVLIPFALMGGFCGYLLVRQSLKNKPDAENELDVLAEHLG